MKYVITILIIMLSLIAIGQLVTPGGVMCIAIDVESSSPRTPHDTDWAYCKTMDQIERYKDSGASISLYNWLINSRLDGGLATTAWVSTKTWFNKNPAELEKFLGSLNPEQRSLFKSRIDR